jgi:glycosyltransferase involved in cell wall biosynthesis
MKLLFTCSDRPEMARNKYYRSILSQKYDYTECVSHHKTYAKRLPSIFFQLLFKLWKKDAYFVSYQGYFLVIFLRLFTKKTIIFDYYVSLHDMIIKDRKISTPNSPIGKLTFWLDKRSLELADHIIVDTTQLINTAVDNYGIDRNKFIRLPLAVNEEKIFPKVIQRHKEIFTLVYMGSYIPFHGVDIVMNAAKILEDQGEEIYFLMLGKGQKYEMSTALAKKHALKNIEFIDFVTMEELNDYYNASDVTLGAFGAGERAKVFITNKAYESFALGKPHLTLETPAMKELFVEDKSIFFVKGSTPSSLAKKILEIKNNEVLCKEVAQNAIHLYNSLLSNKEVTKLLENEVLSKLPV